jgi:hypothetical protein
MTLADLDPELDLHRRVGWPPGALALLQDEADAVAQDLDRRRLAGAVGPEEAEDFAGGDRCLAHWAQATQRWLSEN